MDVSTCLVVSGLDTHKKNVWKQKTNTKVSFFVFLKNGKKRVFTFEKVSNVIVRRHLVVGTTMFVGISYMVSGTRNE